MSDNGFIELNGVPELDEFLSQSGAVPVIVFKHSNTCGISSRAYREMTMVKERTAIVTVQSARTLSNEIESRFALPHETPQVLIVREGALVWSASHFRITAEAVKQALKDLAQ